MAQRLSDHLPTANLHGRDHGKGGLAHTNFHRVDTVLLAPVLTGDILTTPIIENTFFLVLVSLLNLTRGPLSGILRHSLNGNAPATGPFATYAVNDLPEYQSLDVVLVVSAPNAGLGHRLQLQFVGGEAGDVVQTSDIQFDTAALYKFTLESCHVFEARSPRKDTLSFAIDANDAVFYDADLAGLPTNDPAWIASINGSGELGDHGDGDDVPINGFIRFAMTPEPTPVTICLYSIGNFGYDGSTSPSRERQLATYYSTIFSPIWGGLNSGGVAGLNPPEDYVGTPGSIDPLYYGVWYLILWALTLNCDGIVVFEAVTVSGADLNQSTLHGETIRETVDFAGTSSPVGCGATSSYSATRAITRMSVVSSS